MHCISIQLFSNKYISILLFLKHTYVFIDGKIKNSKSQQNYKFNLLNVKHFQNTHVLFYMYTQGEKILATSTKSVKSRYENSLTN